MRHETYGYRIVYGQALFVTFSPYERDSLLMVRLSRTRQRDPINRIDPTSTRFGGRNEPSMDRDFSVDELEEPLLGEDVIDLRFTPEDIAKLLPTSAEREALMARDPLCSVDGFRLLCRLVLEHLFGVRCCPNCPACIKAKNPELRCLDALGCSAKPEGGICGRADAVYGSIENQKSGALHLHLQLCLECLHQRTPLAEIFKLPEDPRLMTMKHLVQMPSMMEM